jgi:hypothetical protein
MTDRNVTYLASVKTLQAEGKRLADIYVMDTTLNRAGWKAKPEAIERAKESLMKQPLLYEVGPGEKSDWTEAGDPFWGGSHKGEWIQAGKPVSFEQRPDGSYHVVYDITSNHAWEDIVSKRAKAASPSCEIYDAHLTRSRDGGEPELELSDLEFNHVLLIPPGGEGAYPKAGPEDYWETQASGFTGAVASALASTERPASTNTKGELIAPEQPPILPRKNIGEIEMTDEKPANNTPSIDYAKLIADKDAEIKARDSKILEQSKMIQEAGLNLRAHEEGLGLSIIQAKYKDTESENSRLAQALKETSVSASIVEDQYRKVMVNQIVSARLESGDLQPNEVDEYKARTMKLPASALDERLQDAERSAKKMRDLGLGRRETYCAGAALSAPRKDLGYTLGDLTGVYGGKQ